MAAGTTIQWKRVGRWMSATEYQKMLATGKAQESFSGTTHVLLLPTALGFIRQAKPGTLYVEFDVPATSLKTTGHGWAKILGPNSIEGRVARKCGRPVPQMPFVRNIEHIAGRLN